MIAPGAAVASTIAARRAESFAARQAINDLPKFKYRYAAAAMIFDPTLLERHGDLLIPTEAAQQFVEARGRRRRAERHDYVEKPLNANARQPLLMIRKAAVLLFACDYFPLTQPSTYRAINQI